LWSPGNFGVFLQLEEGKGEVRHESIADKTHGAVFMVPRLNLMRTSELWHLGPNKRNPADKTAQLGCCAVRARRCGGAAHVACRWPPGRRGLHLHDWGTAGRWPGKVARTGAHPDVVSIARGQRQRLDGVPRRRGSSGGRR
jgi:hypothetical protein